MIIAAAIVVGALVAWLSFRLFFENFGDFLECVRYYLTPDIISWFRGEWAEDWWAETKLFFYFGLSAGCGAVTYLGLHKLVG